MKMKYWFFTGIGIVILVAFYFTLEDKMKNYFILKEQQRRVEQSVYIISKTIDQYNNLFGGIPSSFSDWKFVSLLRENMADTLILQLHPKILRSNTTMYYLYLNGPDGINDSLKTVINEDYVPMKTKILSKSFISYYFSKGDIFLGGASYSNSCGVRSRSFVCIDNAKQIIVENDSLRKKFYTEVNNYLKNIVKGQKLNSDSTSYYAFCHFTFEGDTVSYSILCVQDGNVDVINKFMAGLAIYFNNNNISGVKEVYFRIVINKSLIFLRR